MPVPVILRKCDSYEIHTLGRALNSCLKPLGGWAAFVPAGARVLVKPNFLAARPAEHAVVTHPRLIAEVCRAVLDAGGVPVVGDSPPVGDARRVAKASGAAALLDPMGVEILTLNQGAPRACKHATELPALTLDAGVFGFDRIINLPKLKAHCQCVMTAGVKNLFGCAPGRTKAQWHFRLGQRTPYRLSGQGGTVGTADKFARMLVETATQIAPALTILDGIVAMEGNGPISGSPRHLGFLAASRDPVALDVVAAGIIGLTPEAVPTLLAAREMGVGASRMTDIEVIGESVEKLAVDDFHHPELTPVSFSPAHIIRGYARQLWTRIIGSLAGRKQVT